MSERSLFILSWLDLRQTKTASLEPIINDASQRKYYRLFLDDKTFIVMDSKQDSSLNKFVEIAKYLFSLGLLVPDIYKVDYENGLVLMSDLGKDLYLHKLDEHNAEQLYFNAIQSLLLLQKQKEHTHLKLKPMDEAYIKQNIDVFHAWFLQKHLQLNITRKLQQLCNAAEQLFIKTFNEQPKSLVHLDYHSRNLLVTKDQKTGILDFQDAMIGPITYDLVSLLQDAYIYWPRTKIENWLLLYFEQALNDGLIATNNFKQFIKLFDIVGVQRHLKNLGVFSRLHHRDKKSQYLGDIPRLLRYILEACERYKELSMLKIFFEENIMPHFDIIPIT